MEQTMAERDQLPIGPWSSRAAEKRCEVTDLGQAGLGCPG